VKSKKRQVALLYVKKGNTRRRWKREKKGRKKQDMYRKETDKEKNVYIFF